MTMPTDEEIGQAVLEAARYGDLEDLKELHQNYKPTHLNHKGAGDNTALHYACANGHVDCVNWLVEQGVAWTTNDSGNSPLHWAIQNGKVEVVGALLERLENLDVLVKNSFGKSALSEAFNCGNQDILRMILEHSSASEEALLPPEDVEEEELEAEGDETGDKEEGLVHRFALDPAREGLILSIRELAIKHADKPFGQKASDDTTGLGIWSASLVLARWLVDRVPLLRQASVCELGAGCGVPGLAAAVYGEPAEVILTDINTQTVDNMRDNAHLNKGGMGGEVQVNVKTVDWGLQESWPGVPVDVLLGSDLVYQKEVVPLLSSVIFGVLRVGGTFLYVAPETGRDGADEFIKNLQAFGMELVEEKVAPEHYLANPLQQGEDSDDAFVLHFNDLASRETVYKLYEFVRR